MDNSAANLTSVIGNYNAREQVIIMIMNTLLFYKDNERSFHDGKTWYKHPQKHDVRNSIGRFLVDDVELPEDIETKFAGHLKEYIHPSIHPLIDSRDIYVIGQLHNLNEYWNGNIVSITGLLYLVSTYGLSPNELLTILQVYKR